MRSFLVLSSSVALSLALVACGSSGNSPVGDDASTGDTGAPIDNDAGATSTPDATNDAGTSADATLPTDGSSSSDAGTNGSDAGSGGDVESVDASDGATTITTEAGADSGSITDAAPTDSAIPQVQQLVTTLDPDAGAVPAMINEGTAIGQGSKNGGTPATLADLGLDPNNKETIASDTNPFELTAAVPDPGAGFCHYPDDGGAPYRVTHVTGALFEADAGSDPMVRMAPFYFPLVYNSSLTTSPQAFGAANPIIGLFDWRPKDIDEGLVAAESDDNGLTWYFMQTVLELNPDYTNKFGGGYGTATSTGCPATIADTNASTVSPNGSQADDGWGHATIIQLPGKAAPDGLFLYMLDRNTNTLPDGGSIVDGAPLHAINLTSATTKFPIWNTNKTNNDIKSISSALANTPDSGAPVVVQDTVGLSNPDGIMAVFPTGASDTSVKVLYVQKILNGDKTGSTAMPAASQCKSAPVSGKTNHDISYVRLAETSDGITFTDHGIVEGLNDPTTVDYNGTRWISPRGTLIDINGDGSRWGLYFSGGNCLDGDSDAFHYIGYAESSDMVHWTVYNDINRPIASINTITNVANQAGGASVTIPAHAPVVPTQDWFAERLYAPTAVQIDPTHLSVTFAGYAVQTPANDLLNYRTIGNVVVTVSKALPTGTPNNINAHP